MIKKQWTATVKSDGEDLVLDLPAELIELMDWQVDDTLEWINNHDGTWSLQKMKQKEKK